MNSSIFRRIYLIASIALASLSVAGCGSSVSGTYSSNGNGFFEQLEFKSGAKVEVTFMGMTKEGTYEIEDKKVKVTVGGDNQIFTIDDEDCLVGGGLIGKYCKN
jgi:hypothetical protein